MGKKAVLIGCNYEGMKAELKGCVNNAVKMVFMEVLSHVPNSELRAKEMEDVVVALRCWWLSSIELGLCHAVDLHGSLNPSCSAVVLMAHSCGVEEFEVSVEKVEMVAKHD
ncbi:hypothetical protein LOK49_LG09G02043 [Camellia lanceoleosa]|uniref:Uncharacterized protein n=1 Tax=Camellia lanceoleosa TaxID=1840588 RepID=A0ACC0GN65_9ERIC|nr:hypothetical protein LOK49_LG09G02043 [Camellia lanceoleosa]